MATNRDERENGEVVGAVDEAAEVSNTEMLATIVRSIEERYTRFVDETAGMESPQAQIIIFSRAVKRLAEAGVGLGMLIAQAGRAYGLDLRDIEITDAQGRSLVKRGDEGGDDPKITFH